MEDLPFMAGVPFSGRTYGEYLIGDRFSKFSARAG